MAIRSKRETPMKMRCHIRDVAVLCAAVFVAGAHSAQAGVNVWTSHGPPGGYVGALAVDPVTPRTLYAGTYGGVFKSTDGTMSWQAGNTGLGLTTCSPPPRGCTDLFPVISALAIDRNTPSTLYAGVVRCGDACVGAGVFKSTDGAMSWQAANVGLPDNTGVAALAVDPLRPGTLYAGTDGSVFKSTDGAMSWHAVNTGLPDLPDYGYSIAIDPSAPDTLYAMAGGRVFKSTNGALSWQVANAGLPDSTSGRALAIDPLTPTTLYATTLTDSGGGVFKSTNGALSWQVANAGLPDSFFSAIAIDPTMPGTLYAGMFGAGVFKSTDGAMSWHSVTAAGLDVTDLYGLAIDRSTPDTLYAGTDLGVYSIEQIANRSATVGTGTAASCTDAALNAALDGGGLVTFNCGSAPVTIDISTGTGTKTIAADTIIDGGGLITISGGNAVGVFDVNSSGNFSVENLTIANGAYGWRTGRGTLTVTNGTFIGNGIGIDIGIGNGIGTAAGALVVTHSTFIGNGTGIDGSNHFGSSAMTVSNSSFNSNGSGIVIGFGATMTVSNSTFADNGAGGVVVGGGATMTVANDTFSGNSASAGGAIRVGFGSGPSSDGPSCPLPHAGTLLVTNSTFTGNSASDGGGAIDAYGEPSVINSTFTGNSAPLGGGIFLRQIPPPVCDDLREFAFRDSGASLFPPGLRNTIVANNSGGNCHSEPGRIITDGGHNLDDGTSCGFNTANGSLSNTEPQLDPAGLQNNGGPTQTIALLPTSPAIGAGDQAVCASAPVNDRDQRGFVRPGVGHAQCSIGAYEADAIPAAVCSGDCDGTGSVTIDEIIALVNIALGDAQAACPNGVRSGAEVTVAVIIQAVNNALSGCEAG